MSQYPPARAQGPGRGCPAHEPTRSLHRRHPHPAPPSADPPSADPPSADSPLADPPLADPPLAEPPLGDSPAACPLEPAAPLAVAVAVASASAGLASASSASRRAPVSRRNARCGRLRSSRATSSWLLVTGSLFPSPCPASEAIARRIASVSDIDAEYCSLRTPATLSACPPTTTKSCSSATEPSNVIR